jgi:ABC-2 type transport system permease protein
MALILLPFAANMTIKNVNCAVVDNDHSSFSMQIINRISANSSITLTSVCQSYKEALSLIESEKADMVIVINKDIEKDLTLQQTSADYLVKEPKLLVAANTVNSVKGAIGAMYVMEIVSDFVKENKVAFVETANQSASMQSSPSLEIRPFYAFNEKLEYKFYMVPALMVMVLTVICGFLPALNIVGEKETGSIEQINVTPIGKFTFIISKLIPYWIIGTIVISIGFFVAWLIYGIVPQGSFATVYFFSFLFILAVSGMGLLISNYCSTYQQSMFIMFFFLMVLILMSGLFATFSSMPQWAQSIGNLSPLKYFIEVMRSVYLKGSTVFDLLPQLRSLLIIVIVLNTWAVISYRKKS